MGTRRVYWNALSALLAGWVAVSCGEDTGAESGSAFDDDDDQGYRPGTYGVGGSASTDANAGLPADEGEPALPPEVELDPEFELPHAGERYVYAVNPDRDSVAVIDARTLAIHSVDAGDEPKFLQTLAGTDSAIVLNVKSKDATVIRTKEGKSTASFFDVASDSNSIAVSRDGRHAVVYFDADNAGADSTQLESQSVSVVTLEPGKDRATTTSVGYRPSAVFFSDDGERAFVVTEDGVSVLDFESVDEGGATIAHTVPVSGRFDVRALDVSVTRDGRYALARQQDGEVLRLVELESGDAFELDVTSVIATAREPADGNVGAAGAPSSGSAGTAGADSTPTGGTGSEPAPARAEVTDVDLSPDNTFAIAAVRSDGLVLKIPIPEGFLNPQRDVRAYRVDTGVVGSTTLSPDASTALLYTTVEQRETHVTLLDLGTGELRPIDLHKSVKSVAIAPDGKTALAVHQKLEGDPAQATDEDTKRERSYGYSIVNLETGFARLVLTKSEVLAFTLPEGSSSLFVLLGDPWQVQYMPFDSFVPEHLSLASRPLSIGAVPASDRVFVSQEHPDGRITFIDWDTMEMTSVTGFELNSEIQER